ARVVGPVSTARLWHRLMTEVLGYERYGVQGGDLGCLVSTQLAFQQPRAVVGLHLNLVPPPSKPADLMSEEERNWVSAVQAFRAREMDYFQEHAHKPETVAWALHDHPVGTAAWMLEKLTLWSDAPFSNDQLLTEIMIYLVTGTIGSSVWFYRGVA